MSNWCGSSTAIQWSYGLLTRRFRSPKTRHTVQRALGSRCKRVSARQPQLQPLLLGSRFPRVLFWLLQADTNSHADTFRRYLGCRGRFRRLCRSYQLECHVLRRVRLSTGVLHLASRDLRTDLDTCNRMGSIRRSLIRSYPRIIQMTSQGTM